MKRSRNLSAGILLYRRQASGLEVLLIKPGGPFWHGKDVGAWTVPKGEPDLDEALLQAATREFAEETGCLLTGPFRELQPVMQKAGKKVHAWACAGDFDLASFRSNSFVVEWPPHSGKMQSFPEAAEAAWLDMATAAQKINPAQLPFLAELQSWFQYF